MVFAANQSECAGGTGLAGRPVSHGSAGAGGRPAASVASRKLCSVEMESLPLWVVNTWDGSKVED